MKKIKEFLKRHLAIILLVDAIIIAGLNFVIYPTFIKKDMGLIEIPVATVEIPSGTQITSEMLTETLINPESLPANVETDKTKIVGMYVKEDHTIDMSTFFSKEALATEKDKLGDIFYKLNENEYAFTLKVSGISNADSKFKVGQYIDVMYQEMIVAQDENNENVTMNKVLTGILDNNVRIVYVSKGDESTTITVAVEPDELAYYITANKMGELLPTLSSYAKIADHTSDIYDENMTRQYLDTMSVTYKIVPEIPEEQEAIDTENTELTAQALVEGAE